MLPAGKTLVRFPMVSFEYFIHIILPGRNTTITLTETLTEMVTTNKDGRSVRLTTLPSSLADCLEIWERLNLGNFKEYPPVLYLITCKNATYFV